MHIQALTQPITPRSVFDPCIYINYMYVKLGRFDGNLVFDVCKNWPIVIDSVLSSS